MSTMRPIFDNSNSDIKIRSSDGVEFDLHHTLLTANTNVLSELVGSEACGTSRKTIELLEPASVLSICFGFVYPKKHPDLDDITDFELLVAVAEAVEKYEIYSAMYTYSTRLRSFVPTHATRILVHAIDHGYPKLVELAITLLSSSLLCPPKAGNHLCLFLLHWRQIPVPTRASALLFAWDPEQSLILFENMSCVRSN